MIELNKVIKNNKINLQRVILKIKYNRAHKGISQQDMANKLNMSHRKYQRIEAMESTPNLEVLLETSKVLDICFDELVSPKAPNEIPTNFEILEANFQKIQERFPNTNARDFFDLINNSDFNNIINSDLKNILKLEKFMNSESPLYIADYNICYMNKKYKDLTQRTNFSKPTLQGWLDKRKFAKVWDLLTCFEIPFSSIKSEIKTPAGLMRYNTLNRCFKNVEGKVYCIGTF
jgi:transcriptional regulator with XRE-family HTH domain